MVFMEKHVVSMTTDNIGDLNEKIDSMMEKQNGAWTCIVCGNTNKLNKRSDLKKHVETHIEGVTHSCNICGKTFRSGNYLKVHSQKCHNYYAINYGIVDKYKYMN